MRSNWPFCVCVQELQEKFAGLLTSILDLVDHVDGTNKEIHVAEFCEAYQFLNPTGQLFQLIAQLEEEGFLYEFPITCIPVRLQWYSVKIERNTLYTFVDYTVQ